MRIAALSLSAAALLAATACSAGPPAPPDVASPVSSPGATTPAGPVTPTPAAPSNGASPGPSSAPARARNLPVTDAVRRQLLTRAAAAVHLPANDFVGLSKGNTYFALDTSTGAYWAAAGLIPSSTSTPAQVAVQDDGAYDLFELPGGDPAHGAWKVYPVGAAGPTGSGCGVHPPVDITTLWGWDKGSCRPELLRP